MSYGDYVELIAPGQNSTRRRFAQPKIWVIGSEDELGA